jgi:hypothetical protein
MSKQTIRGTVKELIARNLTIGGQKIDAPTLYSLARLGIARPIDEQKSSPSARRASAVYELDTEIKLNLTAVANA